MKYSLIALVVACLSLSSCTDADRAKMGGIGSKFKVEMYSGGTKVREWISSGKVHSEQGSDGYYFNDTATNTVVEVSGDIVITEL